MTKAPFPHHRPAALALLGGSASLSHKEAGFLGNVCVAATLSDRQMAWLRKLLARDGFPALAEGGSQ